MCLLFNYMVYPFIHIFHHYLWVKFWIYLVKPHCRTHQGHQVYIELAEHTHVFPSSPNNDIVVDGNLVKFSQCKFGWSIKKINPWSYRNKQHYWPMETDHKKPRKLLLCTSSLKPQINDVAMRKVLRNILYVTWRNF